MLQLLAVEGRAFSRLPWAFSSPRRHLSKLERAYGGEPLAAAAPYRRSMHIVSPLDSLNFTRKIFVTELLPAGVRHRRGDK